MATLGFATVATTAPLTVNFDADDPPVDVPALTAASYTPVAGDRVRVEVRTPLQPFIVDKVA
jgi:hypothetical protein